MVETAQPRLFIAKHMFPCVVDEQVILLDLKKDKYLGLDQPQTKAFHSISSRISDATPPIMAEAKNDNLTVTEAVNDLMDKGVLTTNPFDGKNATTVTLPTPPLDLTGYDVKKKRRVRVIYVMRLIKSAMLTSSILRFGSLEYAINRVKKRKAQHLERRRRNKDSQTKDLERVRELVEVFRLIRLFLFTSKDFCLYDSLVLIEFLSMFDVYPDLVVAVKLHPFQAHAWVQDEHFIYNSCVREIDQMTPIMVA